MVIQLSTILRADIHCYCYMKDIQEIYKKMLYEGNKHLCQLGLSVLHKCSGNTVPWVTKSKEVQRGPKQPPKEPGRTTELRLAKSSLQELDNSFVLVPSLFKKKKKNLYVRIYCYLPPGYFSRQTFDLDEDDHLQAALSSKMNSE